MNLRLTAAAVATLVGASVAFAAFEPDDRVSRTASEPTAAPTASTRAFLDSVGINTHFQYTDTAYANRDLLLARLRELGVRHVRDQAPHDAPELTAALQGAAGFGVRLTLGAGDVRIRPEDGVRASEYTVGNAVVGYEGPNELDNSGMADWPVKLRTQMSELRSAVREFADGVPVVGPSLVDPNNYAVVDQATFDLANLHPYPGALPPEEPLAEAISAVRAVGVQKPIVFTETGYHNALATTTGQPPASEATAAVYLPRALLKSFAMGVRRTFIYELVDVRPEPQLLDQDNHFGLLRADLSRKPAFRAVRNLMRAVRKSPGPTRLAPAVASVQADGPYEHVELERSDGSRLLALWRPVSVWDRYAKQPISPSPRPVRVSWSRPVRALALHRPSVAHPAIWVRDSGRRITLSLGGDVALLSYR